MSNCDVVTFPLASWVRCGAWLYRFLIFVLLFTFSMGSNLLVKSVMVCVCTIVRARTRKLVLCLIYCSYLCAVIFCAVCVHFYGYIYIWAMTRNFQQCGILTSVDSDEPVQPHFKLRNSKRCSISSLTLTEYSSDWQRLWSDCAYAPHCWKSHVTAHMLTTFIILF